MMKIKYVLNVNESAPDGTIFSAMQVEEPIRDYAVVSNVYSGWVDDVQEHMGDNYSFKEWNTERDGSGTAYHAGDKLYESTTLYTVWNGETLMPETMEILKGDKRYWLNVLTNFERTKISNALTVSSVREYDVVDFSDWAEWESGNSYEVGDRVKYTYTIVHTSVKGWICIVANSSDTLETTEWKQVSRFPVTGEKDVLYIATLENKAYYWDGDNEEYVCISGDAEGKADKVVNATSGNFAALDSNGNLIDSGHKHSDYLTEHQDVSGKLNVSEKGAANGIAELDANGLVPSSQLPSYVDDVLEFDDKDATHYAAWVSGTSYAVGDKVGYTDSTGNEQVTTYYICTTANSDATFDESNWREAELFPTTGESGKIYVDVTTNITYRWGGSVYVAIGSDLALGETSSTAYRGDRGKAAYDAAVVNVDSTPTTNSTHLITSGGVKAALPGTMTGATSSAAGTSGLVPAPSAGDEEKFLKGDGTWDNVDALPVVTSSDNNKVLEVVDGEWATGSKKIDKEYESSGYTDIWEAKTWSGLTSFAGQYVWSDGDNIYYSNSSDQYVLNKSTSTWSAKSWTGLTGFYGYNIWSDGDNIYYSYNTDQYVLNKSTSTWSEKSWTGLTSFNGNLIWKAGDNIYYSSSSNQYVLDKSTSTWSANSWTTSTGFSGGYGYNIWSDGDNIYYSNDIDQYVLVEDIRILLGTNGEFNSTYLPNFRNLILPSVTSDDNGKVLEVSSKGSWETGTKKALENNSLYYGICTSAANASTKTVTISDFPYTSSNIPSGVKIVILFTNANTAGLVTLSVNNISYTMLRDRSTAVTSYDWNAGELIEVVYLVDGSYHRWMMVNRPYADNTYKGLVSLGDYSTNAYPGNKGAAAYAAAITNVDTEPTIASTHLVTSGGVATALSNLPDAKTITITGTITNTSGSYSGSISDERVTADMKAIALELGNIDAFNSDVTVSCGNGSITISCSDFSGTSTIKVTALKTTEITSNYIVYSESEAPSNPTAGLIWLKKV